tara:strand:+ start:758 stop:1555 length:798 start_codon:yes stop_codon:yes gene_type:complete
MSEDTKEKKVDYLEVDDPIAGQNYVCLSFISPESFIQNKDAFKCVKFLQSYCKDQKLKFEEVYNKYLDFVYKYEDKLQRDFDEQNDFQTSIRGLKVRGVFDTKDAANDRAKKLSVRDSAFHTFVGQVGYWLPWDPNADKVSDEVFQNSQLNDMMEKYQQNNVNRDMFYEEQKREKIKAAQEEVRKAEEEKKKLMEEKDVSEEYPIEEDPDKEVEDVEEVKEVEEVKKVEEVSEMKKGSEVSEDIKDSLESDDPWIQRKKDEEKTE